MNPTRPKRLLFEIGGYDAPTYSITLIDDKVQYRLDDFINSTVEIINPSAQQWLEFHAALNKMQVWNWKRKYPNMGCCDGLQWKFEVAYDNKKIKCVGDNNYPLENGDPSGCSEYSKEFKCLVKAIKKLIGGREIEL
jgi:hypothetical protein